MGRMVQVTEAVFSKGILKPVGSLRLREQQRVRLIIEAVDGGQDTDRAAALQRLRAGIEQMTFSSSGPLPTRDELHDRS
jgi:predicted DNA-binding antitoxin AbrB/MazE fold protein